MVLSRVVSEIFNVEKYCDLEIPIRDHSRSSEPTRIDSPPITYCFIGTMGLSRTVSEIEVDLSRKLQIFPHPVYFAPMLMGFPLELGIGIRDQKTRMMGLPDCQKRFKIGLAV